MGGRGSGRKPSNCGKSETQHSLPLDIRKLARQELLMPGNAVSWQWLVNDQVVGSISILVELDVMVLCYQRKSAAEDIRQRVLTHMTPCNLGGHRHWFTCPHCSRRVAILYGPGKYFSCRHCCGLAYASQKEGKGDRATRQADTIRKRMGWEAGILNGVGGKPKGMHWKTFLQLKTRHDALLQVSIREIAQKLGFLDRLLAE